MADVAQWPHGALAYTPWRWGQAGVSPSGHACGAYSSSHCVGSGYWYGPLDENLRRYYLGMYDGTDILSYQR